MDFWPYQFLLIGLALAIPFIMLSIYFKLKERDYQTGFFYYVFLVAFVTGSFMAIIVWVYFLISIPKISGSLIMAVITSIFIRDVYEALKTKTSY